MDGLNDLNDDLNDFLIFSFSVFFFLSLRVFLIWVDIIGFFLFFVLFLTLTHTPI